MGVQETLEEEVYLFSYSSDGKTVINNIARRRKQLGMTQKQFASLLGTTQSRVSEIEKPTYNTFTLATLAKLAVCLDCVIDVSFFNQEKTNE